MPTLDEVRAREEMDRQFHRMCRALAAHAMLAANPHVIQQNIGLTALRDKVDAVAEFITEYATAE